MSVDWCVGRFEWGIRERRTWPSLQSAARPPDAAPPLSSPLPPAAAQTSATATGEELRVSIHHHHHHHHHTICSGRHVGKMVGSALRGCGRRHEVATAVRAAVRACAGERASETIERRFAFAHANDSRCWPNAFQPPKPPPPPPMPTGGDVMPGRDGEEGSSEGEDGVACSPGIGDSPKTASA